MSIFPTRILVAIDGSDFSERALKSAIELAKSNDSELHVVHAAPTSPPAVPHVVHYGMSLEEKEQYKQSVRQNFGAHVDRVEGARETARDTHLRFAGRVDVEIVGCAEEIGAGLIVVGSRGKNPMQRLLLGSVAESVVSHAPCPVLVVRQEAQEETEASGTSRTSLFPGRLLLATDGSEDAELALGVAVELSNTTGSELHVMTVENRGKPEYVSVGHPELLEEIEDVRAQIAQEANEMLDLQVEKIEKSGGIVTGQHIPVWDYGTWRSYGIGQEIGASLIIVGSRGLGMLRRVLMGSVSASVVRPRPLLRNGGA